MPYGRGGLAAALRDAHGVIGRRLLAGASRNQIGVMVPSNVASFVTPLLAATDVLAVEVVLAGRFLPASRTPAAPDQRHGCRLRGLLP